VSPGRSQYQKGTENPETNLLAGGYFRVKALENGLSKTKFGLRIDKLHSILSVATRFFIVVFEKFDNLPKIRGDC
jgi:hypothetical protein